MGAWDGLGLLGGFGDYLAVVKALDGLARRATGRPTVEEARALREYVRIFEQRRVFHVSYNIEMVECCNGSLRSFADATEQTLATVEHEHCVVLLETIQQSIRTFLDKWQGIGTTELLGTARHRPDRFRDAKDFRDPPWHMRGELTAEYFMDLGAVRSTVNTLIAALRTAAPKAKPRKRSIKSL